MLQFATKAAFWDTDKVLNPDSLIAALQGVRASFLNFLDSWQDLDPISQFLDRIGLSDIRIAISTFVRSMGFGPEADGIATFLVVFFIVMMIIGIVNRNPSTDVANKDYRDDNNKDKK